MDVEELRQDVLMKSNVPDGLSLSGPCDPSIALP